MENQRKTASKRRARTPGAKANVGQSQSLTRGLLLLEHLAEAGHGLQLTDLAQQVGLAPSTTHRLLNTLEQMRFVQQDEKLGLWFIGVKAFLVGNAFLNNYDFVTQSRPFMHRLMELSGETINLAVVDEGEAVFLAQVECHEMMRMIVKLGSRNPLHASAVGKALLATMPEPEISAILHKRGLPRFTDSTITNPAKLRTALAEVRKQGYAYDDEEHAIGLRCVAATIHDHLGEALGAISLSGPKARMPDERIPELGAMVARTAAEITASLGGQLPTASAAANRVRVTG